MKNNKSKQDTTNNKIKIIVKSVANGNQSLSEALIPVIFEDLKKSTHSTDKK
jgi:hypothetical protein